MSLSPGQANPKAFISHATGDAVFVEKLATDLRSSGVDAWYSEWEIRPGDSIRAKIDDGLSQCEIFVIILSKASIKRPWVQTELDAATIRKLDGRVQKIIPVKLDDCGEPPPLLGSLHGVDFSSQSYEIALKKVLESIFLVETKPVLGDLPNFTEEHGFGLKDRPTTFVTTRLLMWTLIVLAAAAIASRATINLGVSPVFEHLLVGLTLAGIVWKFFERCESVMTDDAKFDVAIWLLGVKTATSVQRWTGSFLSLVDRAFGERKLSWRSFRRSCIATYACIAMGMTVGLMSPLLRSPAGRLLPPGESQLSLLAAALITSPILLAVFTITQCLPDYLSFMKTRRAIERFARSHSTRMRATIIGLDLAGSLAFAFGSSLMLMTLNWCAIHQLATLFPNAPREYALALRPYLTLQIRQTFAHGVVNELAALSYPAFFGTIWFALYITSGSLLKGARRFDTGFQWFNERFDIERRPLQSIGMVGGTLLALIYWVIALVMRVFG
jgi:hypothetical protein